jgi:hypothetical protein
MSKYISIRKVRVSFCFMNKNTLGLHQVAVQNLMFGRLLVDALVQGAAACFSRLALREPWL